jgi:hypothetical protein
MLWIVMYAAIVGSPIASASKIAAASSRRRPVPPTSSRTYRAEAELARLGEHVPREVLAAVPVERVRREPRGGELADGVQDGVPLFRGERAGTAVMLM